MRRRRRRGGGLALSPRAGMILLGMATLALIGAFIMAMGAAEDAKPLPKETRIELPDAFK